MHKTTKRGFLKAALASGLALEAFPARSASQKSSEQLITIIDLDKCDGCSDLSIPACVRACRAKNQARYPEPQKPVQPYWPQPKYEDFSNDRDNISRLTPYNWIYLQHVSVDGKDIYLPRRCMQCFDAPCRKLCPFGAIDQTKPGAVKIDDRVCFGGAKCRDVCPWNIPQRQAGVGIYLKVEPKLAGGGVMYKCDFCADLIAQGKEPACSTECPKKAMLVLPISQAEEKCKSLANDRFVYGKEENGGTATWYVCSVPFEKINRQLHSQLPKNHPGRPLMNEVDSKLSQSTPLVLGTLAAPIVALGASVALRKRKNDKDQSQ